MENTNAASRKSKRCAKGSPIQNIRSKILPGEPQWRVYPGFGNVRGKKATTNCIKKRINKWFEKKKSF